MDIEQIRHVAELAELSLTAEEEQRLAEEIGRIVAYVEELQKVDTSGVEAAAHAFGIVPQRSEEGWREDAPEPGISHEDALEAAPETGHGGFVVPTFVES